MKNFLTKNRYIIGGICFGFVVVLALSTLIVEKKLSNLQQNIEIKIQNTESALVDLSTVIAKGKANEFAKQVVVDCTSGERALFDSRLAKLDAGLSQPELNEIDVLFSKCASVDAVQKAAMVLQLRNMINDFKMLIEQRKLVGNYTEFDDRLVKWEYLLEQDESISELSFALVSLQGEIIQSLLHGLAVDSSTANDLRIKGQSLRNDLTELVLNSAKTRDYLSGKTDTI